MAFEDLDAGGARERVVGCRGHGGKAGEEGGFRGIVAGVVPLVAGEAWANARCGLVGGGRVGRSAEFGVLGAELGEFGFEGSDFLMRGAELGDFVAEAHQFEFVGVGEVGLLGSVGGGGLGLAEAGFELLNLGVERVAVTRDGPGLAPGRDRKNGSGDEQGQKKAGKFVHKWMC